MVVPENVTVVFPPALKFCAVDPTENATELPPLTDHVLYETPPALLSICHPPPAPTAHAFIDVAPVGTV
jgi:hypothetical protein